MTERPLYSSQAMSQAFRAVLGETAVRRIEVPREIKFGIPANNFLEKLKMAYNVSKNSKLVFK